jgi:hypothetical protein
MLRDPSLAYFKKQHRVIVDTCDLFPPIFSHPYFLKISTV